MLRGISTKFLFHKYSLTYPQEAEDKLEAAGFSGITYGFATDEGGQSNSGLSGGAVAGIVIAVLLVVAAVGAVAAYIL